MSLELLDLLLFVIFLMIVLIIYLKDLRGLFNRIKKISSKNAVFYEKVVNSQIKNGNLINRYICLNCFELNSSNENCECSCGIILDYSNSFDLFKNSKALILLKSIKCPFCGNTLFSEYNKNCNYCNKLKDDENVLQSISFQSLARAEYGKFIGNFILFSYISTFFLVTVLINQITNFNYTMSSIFSLLFIFPLTVYLYKKNLIFNRKKYSPPLAIILQADKNKLEQKEENKNE